MSRNRTRKPDFVPFPSTHWSQLPGAADAQTRDAFERLSAAVSRYYPALLAHLVHIKGIRCVEAEDILHDFMRDKVLGRGLLSQATSGKGRFRTFILTALDRYVVSAHRRKTARKRVPELPPEPAAVAAELPTPGVDHSCFDRVWAQELIREALRRMEQECAESGRPELWALFQARIVAPALEGSRPLPYEAMQERYALPSPAAAHNLLVTAKRMYVRCLEAVVADYLADDGSVSEELKELRSVCTGR
jgi:RNA polymerase sigma-70 factor (ECF subfamily)